MVELPAGGLGPRSPNEVDRLCGPRFVPDPSMTLPGRPVLYVVGGDVASSRDRPGHYRWVADSACYSGKTILATDEEVARWEAAMDTYVDALLDAKREIMAAHGVEVLSDDRTGITYRLPGDRPWYPLTVRCQLARVRAAPRRLWAKRSTASRAALAAEAKERSFEAQRRYATQVAAASEAYRPTAEAVAGRLRESAAHITQELVAVLTMAHRQEEVADRRVWGYELAERDAASTVVAFRHDIVADEPRRDRAAETAPGSAHRVLTGYELKEALLDLPDEPTIEWEPAAQRATVAELCPPGDPARAFEDWWTWLPVDSERDEGADATSGHTHASTHHTSHGAHLAGGWSGSVHT